MHDIVSIIPSVLISVTVSFFVRALVYNYYFANSISRSKISFFTLNLFYGLFNWFIMLVILIIMTPLIEDVASRYSNIVISPIFIMGISIFDYFRFNKEIKDCPLRKTNFGIVLANLIAALVGIGMIYLFEQKH